MFLKQTCSFHQLTHDKVSSPFYFCDNNTFGQQLGNDYDLVWAKPKINWLSTSVYVKAFNRVIG